MPQPRFKSIFGVELCLVCINVKVVQNNIVCLIYLNNKMLNVFILFVSSDLQGRAPFENSLDKLRFKENHNLQINESTLLC